MTLPSWDLLVPAGLVLVVLYTVLILRKRATSVVIGSYLAYLVTAHWGRPLYGFLTGGRSLFGFSLSLNLPPFTVEAALYAALWAVFASVVLVGAKAKTSMFEKSLLGLSAGGIATVSLVSLLADADRAAFIANNHLVATIMNYQELFFLIPVILLLWIGLRPAPRKSSSSSSSSNDD